MRIGLIGLGRIGAFHADTLAGLPRVEELIVTDFLGTAVQAVTERIPKARGVASPEAMLDAGLDGVIIAASTTMHAELLLASVEHGIPTFCEKPIAGTVDEAIKVRERIGSAGVPVQIGYPRRFDPAFVAAREALQSGVLGRVHTVRSTTMDPAPPPAAYLAGSGGIFHDCAVHDFDAVRWVTGREVAEVYAVGTIDPSAPEEMYLANGDFSSASTLLTMDDGTIGVISNTRTNARGYDVRLEVHGSDDSVAAGFDEGLPLRATQPGITWPAGPPHTFFMDRLADAFRRELAIFCEVATGAAESPCPLEDALMTTWVAEAATLSAKERRPVRMEEVLR
ncbi:Gfo/Idh/MocA family oxidoreductase [Nocardia sp. NPDC049526]|uniref:Gfo/Idh/MocA family protein n=1 Tax=Nocardia sp. NPDC049526 TaxID=3364316 RepID=UPI0037A6073D